MYWICGVAFFCGLAFAFSTRYGTLHHEPAPAPGGPPL